MIKKGGQFLLGLLLLVMISMGMKVSAQEQLGSTHTQELIIIKYGLSSGASGFSQTQTVNNGEEINGLPTDNNGNQLTPLSGIHYLIQKISPTTDGDAIKLTDGSTYINVGEATEIITNSSGIAQLELQDGFYIVTECANKAAGLSHPAQPILLRLPVVNDAKNGYLNQVYIYPKSSIDPSENIPSPPATIPKMQKNLPKTGESDVAGLSLLGLVLVILAVSAVIINLKLRRKGGENELK